jgi:nicotinamidase-related amidase
MNSYRPTCTQEDTMATDPLHETLTAENTAVVFVDHQVGLYTGVRDISLLDLKHNTVALATAATALGLPLIVTTTARDSMWGPITPELQAAFPEGQEVIDRSTVNAWDDERVRSAVAATGRTKLVITGISLEVCAAFPAIAALADGYQTYVAVDASGTFSATERETGIARLQQAGVVVSDYATFMVEVLADNAAPVAGEVYGALDMSFATLLGQVAASYQN